MASNSVNQVESPRFEDVENAAHTLSSLERNDPAKKVPSHTRIREVHTDSDQDATTPDEILPGDAIPLPQMAASTPGSKSPWAGFQVYYTSTLPESASAISWIGSIQTWLTYFIGAFSGRLLDAGFFLPTFVIGALLQLLGIFLMAVSKSYWHLMLTQGVLTGLGGGIFFTPSLALVATYFSKKRGLAMGIATTGNSAGLLPKVGFKWTALTLGFINMAGLLLVVSFMRPRLPPRRSGPIIDWTAFTEPIYVTYVFGVFFFIWTVFYTMYYVASFGKQVIGLSQADATLLVTIINGAGFPTRVLVPILADRFGVLNVVTLSAAGVACVAFSWLAVRDVPGVYAFTVTYGLVNGGYQSLISTGIAAITKRLDMVGTRMGMCFSVASIAGLTGPPIGGLIQQAAGASGAGRLCGLPWLLCVAV
uniref:Major facilitator superfamily (MFS) profile domain-containing protein n=1 Tax=Bionectria ochroleuca TaxID=29856 RepID=A0A8H7TV93_BIOOC